MLFEAIAAIKIANEAVSAIKEFAGHVESVGQLGPQLTKLTDAKDEIRKKADEGDMDAFFALEDITRRESEIKTLFIWAGRPGLWDDYQKFQQTRRTLRENERRRLIKKRLRRKRIIIDTITIGSATLFGLGAVIASIWVFLQIIK